MKFSNIFFSMLVITNLAAANVINVETSDKSIEGVKIARSATLKNEAGEIKLDFLGAGLRTKKVLVSNVKVYVTQVLADNAGKFVRTNDGALKSIEDMNTVAFTLTFLRDVEAEKVMTAFIDSFDANDVDTSNPGIKAFLTSVKNGGEASDGKTMTILLSRNTDGTTKVTYEATNGKTFETTGDKSVLVGISSIWLGKSADAGLATLKTSILKGE
jgi:hypothetical protein